MKKELISIGIGMVLAMPFCINFSEFSNTHTHIDTEIAMPYEKGYWNSNAEKVEKYIDKQVQDVVHLTQLENIRVELANNKVVVDETELSESDIALLTDLVMAEAEDQSYEAKYGVACVVLNRLKSGKYDTLHDVIYAKNQFTCIWNGRFNKVSGNPNEECVQAVVDALHYNSFPSDVLYFTSCGYLHGTEPYVKKDDMYFSKKY